MKLSVLQGEEMLKSFFTGEHAGDRVNNRSGFNVDFSLWLGGLDLEDAGATAETFNLDDVGQADLLQSAGETLRMAPGEQIIQNVENEIESVAGDGFFQEQFRACREALGAESLIGYGGQNDELDFRVAAPEHGEQLQTVEHRHVDVENGKLELALLDEVESLVGSADGLELPGTPGQVIEEFAGGLKKSHAVIHKEQAVLSHWAEGTRRRGSRVGGPGLGERSG
jgi:hypothetical protein